MKRVFQKRLFKIVDCVSESSFTHIAIGVRYFKKVSYQFVNVNDLKGSVIVVFNEIINWRANNSTVSVISPIIASEIDGVVSVGGSNLRTTENFLSFRVKDGAGVFIETNEMSNMFGWSGGEGLLSFSGIFWHQWN